MRQFSTAELVEHIGDVTHAASQAPVAITQHRKARYVLLTAELFETMRREGDPRRAFGAGELPEEESAAVTKALEGSIEELELSRRDRVVFFDTLVNPPAPNARLKRAFAERRRRTAR